MSTRKQTLQTYAEEQLEHLKQQKEAELTAKYAEIEKSPRQKIMEEAISLTCGQRNVEYGPPVRNMRETAELWTTFLGRKLSAPITAAEVGTMMGLLKISRMIEDPMKGDTYADACAYIAIGFECAHSD